MTYDAPSLPGNVAVVRVVAVVLSVDSTPARLVAAQGASTYGDTLPQGFLYASQGEALSAALRRIVHEQTGAVLSTNGVVLSVIAAPRNGDQRSTLSVIMGGIASRTSEVYSLDMSETANALTSEHHQTVQESVETLKGRLLRDASTSYNLLGNVVTNRAAVSVLGGCGVRAEVALSRLAKSPLYRPTTQGLADDPDIDPDDLNRMFYRSRPRHAGSQTQ